MDRVVDITNNYELKMIGIMLLLLMVVYPVYYWRSMVRWGGCSGVKEGFKEDDPQIIEDKENETLKKIAAMRYAVCAAGVLSVSAVDG